MFQVRIHGRGGQGVVTGAEMLSIAAFLGGRHAQAFPSFGSERTGAPVVAFCRMDDKEIRLREPIMQPDAIIIQDPTLPASELGMKHVRRAVPNVPLLGAFAALCGLISLDAVQRAIDEKFKGPVALGNQAAAAEAYKAAMAHETLEQEIHHA